MAKKRFSPVTPLTKFFAEIGISVATGKKRVKCDPDFPVDELVQIGGFADQPRFGITERGKQRYQTKLAERAKQPRGVPVNLRDPQAAAEKSIEVRRAKAAARRTERVSGS